MTREQSIAAGDTRHDVTIVIPAKNEGATIAQVIGGCTPFAHEIIVVDGRSSDGTPDIAAACGAKVLTDGGRGKGDAIRTAIPHIKTEIVVFIDADGSHETGDIPSLLQPLRLGEADHVSASRLRGGSSELHGGFDEFFRLAGSAFVTACINWKLGVRLSDSQNGFRAIRTALLRSLDLREDLTTIEQEMIIKTLRARYRMAEVPSHEKRRLHGVSHVRVWRSAPFYIWSLARYLFF